MWKAERQRETDALRAELEVERARHAVVAAVHQEALATLEAIRQRAALGTARLERLKALGRRPPGHESAGSVSV